MLSLTSFTRQGLDDAGFSEWEPITKLSTLDHWPESPGVYLVRYGLVEPSFAERSYGGWFKGRDPAVSQDILAANWVTGADIVYIGKANLLRRRMRELIRFGEGHAIGHWGGRLMWQLQPKSALEISWLQMPTQDPREIEIELIAQFRAKYGKPPFANDPHRLGG
jgi:hypothetical protein